MTPASRASWLGQARGESWEAPSPLKAIRRSRGRCETRLGLDPDQGIVVLTGLGLPGDASTLKRFLAEAPDDHGPDSGTDIVAVYVTDAGVERMPVERLFQREPGPGGEDALVLRR